MTLGRCQPERVWPEVVGFTAQEPSSTVSRPGRLTKNRIFDWLETQAAEPVVTGSRWFTDQDFEWGSLGCGAT